MFDDTEKGLVGSIKIEAEKTTLEEARIAAIKTKKSQNSEKK